MSSVGSVVVSRDPSPADGSGCPFYGRYTDTCRFKVLKTTSSGLELQLPPDITCNAASVPSLQKLNLVHLSQATALGSGVNKDAVPK